MTIGTRWWGIGIGMLAPAYAFAGGCFIDLHRPLPDAAPWGAHCNPAGVAGVAVNLLDGLPSCGGSASDCFENPEIKVQFPSALPTEGRVAPPTCFSPGPREWVHMGWVNFGRSCFRGLGAKDPARIRDWAKQVVTDRCEFNEMGAESRVEANGPREAKDWAARLTKRYGSSLAPKGGSAAQVIYASFKQALAANNGCLSALNPRLASRMGQAMGTDVREQGGGVYRPSIDCQQQEAYDCARPEGGCEAARAAMQKAYGEPSGENRDFVANRIRSMGCKPAHPEGTILGGVDGDNLKAGSVARGSPRIKLFNVTLESGAGSQLASTILHEFLHAAGAAEGADHNHGTEANQVPAGDQVYGCQALAFRPLFEALPAADLRRACEACADEGHRAICAKPEAELVKLGCRLP